MGVVLFSFSSIGVRVLGLVFLVVYSHIRAYARLEAESCECVEPLNPLAVDG